MLLLIDDAVGMDGAAGMARNFWYLEKALDSIYACMSRMALKMSLLEASDCSNA